MQITISSENPGPRHYNAGSNLISLSVEWFRMTVPDNSRERLGPYQLLFWVTWKERVANKLAVFGARLLAGDYLESRVVEQLIENLHEARAQSGLTSQEMLDATLTALQAGQRVSVKE